MAKNWKVSEALAAIKKGEVEAIVDIGKRFPLFLMNTQTFEGLYNLLNALPDYVTVRKLEAILRNGVEENEEDVNVEVEVTPKKVKAEKQEKAEVTKKPVKKAVEEVENEDDEEEEVEVKAKKPAKAKTEKQEKPAKKVEVKNEEEEEDDDWDI